RARRAVPRHPGGPGGATDGSPYAARTDALRPCRTARGTGRRAERAAGGGPEQRRTRHGPVPLTAFVPDDPGRSVPGGRPRCARTHVTGRGGREPFVTGQAGNRSDR